MGSAPTTCKVYIVFHHALFAQAIRSLLRGRRAMRVIGMESETTKALEAVRSLQPDVIIVEESDVSIQSPSLQAILQRHPAGRVVALDLDHNFATLYDRHRVVTTQPADLVRAILGFPGRRDDAGSGGEPKARRADFTHESAPLTPLTGRSRRQR